jgi:hypothetical protein
LPAANDEIGNCRVSRLNTGLLNIAKLDLLTQSTMPLKTGTEFDGMLYFLLGRHWNFSERLYERAAVDFPMKMLWRFTAVGNTSIDLSHTYYEDVLTTPGSASAANAVSTPLASCVCRIVHVNPVTRKPEPMPDSSLSSIKRVITDDQRFSSITPPTSIPAGCYC